MRQHTPGSLLRGLLDAHATHRVDIQVLETGDVDHPTARTIRRDVPVIVQALSAGDRVLRAEDYELQTTHRGYCRDSAELVIGSRWVEMARRTEDGRWRRVDADEAQMWLVQGREAIPGIPEPDDQVSVDLHQLIPTRGAFER